MFCAECGGDMILTTEPLTEKYKGMEITVSGLEYYICPDCGETLMSGDMADKQKWEMARVYAETYSILSPQEIVALRKKLGLTQKDFEKLLGVSSPTVCRWERGMSQQSAAANNLMRVLKDVPGAAHYLMKAQGLIAEPAKSRPAAASFTLVHGRPKNYGASRRFTLTPQEA